MSFPKIFLALIVLIGWSCEETEYPTIIEDRIEFYDIDPQWADSVLNTLSLKDKISQLLVVGIDYLDSSLRVEKYAGIIINDKAENVLTISNLNKGLIIPMFIGSDSLDFAGLLSGEHKLINGYTLDKITLDSLLVLESEIKRFLGINFSLPKVKNEKWVYNPLLDNPLRHAYIQRTRLRTDYLKKIVHVSGPYFFSGDLHQLTKHEKMANSAVVSLIDSGLVSVNFLKPKAEGKVSRKLKKLTVDKSSCQGLKVWSNLETKDSNELMNAFLRGADLIHVSIKDSNKIEKFICEMIRKVSDKDITIEDIDSRIRKSLIAKTWMNRQPISRTMKEFNHTFQVPLIGMQQQLFKQAVVLVKNENNSVPIVDVNRKTCFINYGSSKASPTTKNNYQIAVVRRTPVNRININSYINFEKLIVTINEELDDNSSRDLLALTKLDHLKELIIINVNNPINLKWLSSLSTVMQVFNQDKEGSVNILEALYGGVAITARLPKKYGDFEVGHGLDTKKTRLEYSLPEEVGIRSDSLVKIRKIVREMIFSEAGPGCQVMAIKSGKIIYHESFGHFTYDKMVSVRNDDIFDLASVTKILATTPAFMHFYEQGAFKLQDSLKLHLPDSLNRILGRPSSFNDITFSELLTHKSGAPSGLRLKNYLEYQNDTVGRWDSFFCNEENETFSVPVANKFFLDRNYLDSIWLKMNAIRLDSSKSFKYSDINMNMLYLIMKSKLNKTTFSKFVDSIFYRPMGLTTIGYLPMHREDTLLCRIAPTEYDSYWRGGVLKGFVHDPTAALFGGEAGNAGLFGSAADIGVFCQMLLNGGTYGGHRYLKETTVDLFTSRQFQSHRGLGFDKPTNESSSTRSDDCPTSAYGHTGFTGICTWVDPENQLIFVFCSNRVHPNPLNNKINTMRIRARLHQVFYDQLLE